MIANRIPSQLRQCKKMMLIKSWNENCLYVPRMYSVMRLPMERAARVPQTSVASRGYTVPGTPGAGAGKGGGAGGAIKEGGGGLGRFGAAQEEGYFYHKDREQMEKLKKTLKTDEPSDNSKDEGNKNQQG